MPYTETNMSNLGKLSQYLRCDFEYVKTTDDIIFIKDLNRGRMSVTNDADEVFRLINKIVFPGRRVVYQDSDGEWFEIVDGVETWMGKCVGFKPWHGEVWDILTKV